MSDFYSVLRQTLIDRNLRSGAARQDAYTQARTAMIRRLWSFDPPLAEDEIDARIGQFDIAVDRIEHDVVAAFAEADAMAAAERARRLPPPPPPPPPPAPVVYDGYDEMADYAAAFGGQASPGDFADDPEDDPFADAARHAAGFRPTTMEERSRMVEAALAERFDAGAATTARLPAPPQPAQRAPLQARRVEPENGYDFEPPAGRSDYDEGDGEPDPYTAPLPELADELDDLPPVPVAERQQRRPPAPPPPAFDDEPRQADADDEIDDDEAPPRQRVARRRPARLRNRERTLLIAVAALGVVFVATSLYVFLPLLFGSVPTGTVTSPAAPAAPAVSAAPADAIERITLFNGSDPTVFEADSNNPIRFTGSGDSGFATVSTSSSSSGARVLIGSGLSTRLAGEDVRVNLVARAAREQGAVSMRFAYQSGLAISHWQTMSLTPEFETASFVWRVPKMRTNPAGDYILIEPGIPGDGTSAEIQSVTIDVLRK